MAGLTVLGGGRVSGFLTVTDGLVVSAGSRIIGETSIIGGLRATGITTFTSNSVNAVQFNVTGVSTFASSKTSTGFTTNTTNTNLNVTGIATITNGTSKIFFGFQGGATVPRISLRNLAGSVGGQIQQNVVNGDMTLSSDGNVEILSGSSLKCTDTTESTSTSTGALIVSGGAGIAKKLNVGAGLSVVGLCTASEYGGPTGGRWQVGASGTAHYTFTGPGFGGTVTLSLIHISEPTRPY